MNMSALVLHWRSWWARLLAKARPAVTPPSAVEAVPRPAPAPATATEQAAAAVGEDVPAGRAVSEMAPLLETVGLPALQPAAVELGSKPKLTREATLAALRDLRQIPALQSLAQGFKQATNRPDVSVPEVVAAINKDGALCVRVLRMANSALVGSDRRIEDLETAVQMLGVVRVRKTAQALFTLNNADKVAEGFDWRHLWVHALATAAIAEELERRLRSAGDSQIHLAALLHDVGKIVLSTIAAQSYRDVLVRAWGEGGRLEVLERETLGVDHREAGVMFATHNGLPAMVVQAIAHHHDPAGAATHRLEVALIALANHLSKAHGLGFSGARLDESDGDFATHPAWRVVEEECGGGLDPEAIEADLGPFLSGLRAELRGLRQGN
jgi:putative nucleotidyltransferase with HDIG domain